jgi:O-antigen/teichoic acid export membrane protein/O-antigen ligase
VSQPTTRRQNSRPWRTGASDALAGSLLAAAFSQAVLVVSGVLLARALGPEDRGYMALVFLVPTLLALAGNVGIPLACTYFVARNPGAARAIAAKLVTPVLLQTAAGVLLTLGALLTVLSDEPGRVIAAGLVTTALVPALLIQIYGMALLQGQQRFRAFNVLRTMPPFLNAVGLLAAVVTGFHSLFELTVVTVGANVLAAGLILEALLRGLDPPGDAATDDVPSLGELTRFGLKGFFGSISPVESFRLDQAAVAVFLNPVALGIYVVAQAFINLPRFVAQSVGMVAYPRVAARHDPELARRSLWRHFALGTALALAAVGALELAVPALVPLFFGDAFSEAVPIARILLIGAFFVSARRILADGVRGMGHPGLGTSAEIVSWLVLLPSVVVLAPAFGAEGVAMAVTGAWVTSFLVLLAATLLVLPGHDKRLRATIANWSAGTGLRSAGALLPAVAASLLAAAVVVLLDPLVSLGIVAALGLLVVAAVIRREFGDGRHPAPVVDEGAPAGDQTSPSDDDEDDFRLARFLFYAGFLLIGQLTLRPAAIGTFSDVLFLASFASAVSLLAIYKRRVVVAIPPLLAYGLILFSVGGFASTFASVAPNASIGIVLRLVVLTALWFWLGTIVLRRVRHIVTAAALWVASAALNGIGAIAQLTIDPDIIPRGYVHWGRVTGFTEHMNDLGGMAAVALVPALMFCIRSRRNPLLSLVAYASLLLTAAALVLSGSVGAMFAAAVVGLLFIAAAPRLPARFFVFAGIALIGAVALVQAQESRDAPTPAERLERVTGSPTDPNSTLWSRVETYEGAIDRIMANPFTGVGLDGESSTIGNHEPHNLVIGVWFKAGFLGIAGLMLIILAVLSVARASLRHAASSDERIVALALLCAFLAFVVFAMSAPILFTRIGWAPAPLLLALRAIQLRRTAPRPAPVLPAWPELAPARGPSLAHPR